MAKRRLSKMLEDMGKVSDLDPRMEMSMEIATDLMQSKLAEDMFKKWGKDFWITEEGQEILLDAAEVPEIVPKHYIGFVQSKASNPRFVYAVIKELEKKVPVVIPTKWARRVLKKNIKIEAITDINGTTYRYVR